MRKLFQRKKGFTLVELLVVIAIIGILVTIAIIAINPQTVLRQTNDTKRRSEINQVKVSLQLYFNDNNEYPDTADFVTELEPDYMRDIPNENYYGYLQISTTDYIAGAELEAPTSDDVNSFTKCDQVGGITLKRFDDLNEPLALTELNGYLVCPD